MRPEELPERVNDIVDRLRAAEKEIEKVRLQQLLASAGQLVAGAEDVGGVSFVGHLVDGAGGGDVRTLALDIRGRMTAERPGVAAIIGSANGKPSVVVALNDAARGAGISANTLVRAASEVLGGKGGGKDDVAQGGGADASKAPEALTAIRRALAEGPALAGMEASWSGVRLGVDPGDARIGVASSDPSGILATPVETVPRGAGDLDRLAALVDELGAVRVYVGLPRSLSGRRGTLGR